MNTKATIAQSEVDSAWALWEALSAHMETLWVRYEEPFSKRMLRELAQDEEQIPWREDFTDDDIPF